MLLGNVYDHKKRNEASLLLLLHKRQIKIEKN
jgi:hypothetical protein